MSRFKALIYHRNVARIDAETRHRVAIHHRIEGGLGMLDEVAIEVKTITEVIFCWRRESRLDRRRIQQIQLLFEFSFDQFHGANIIQRLSQNAIHP